VTPASRRTLKCRHGKRGGGLRAYNAYMRSYRQLPHVREKSRLQRKQWMQEHRRYFNLYHRVLRRLKGVMCACGKPASPKATIMLGEVVCRGC